MARRHNSPSLHPALALAGALVLHVQLLALAALVPAPPATPAKTTERQIEIAVVQPREVEAVPREVTTGERAPQKTASSRSGARGGRSKSTSWGPVAPMEVLTSPDGTDEPIASSPVPRPHVDLGLGGSIARGMVLDARGAERRKPRHSAGRLAEELDARDGARGMGRSSAAVSVAYSVAGLGPPMGMAVFEIRTDGSGRVASVTVVGARSDNAHWQRVATALRAKLARRRLRVRPGSKGLLCRLRIERGELAKDNADQGRTKRGVALGQGSLGPKDVRGESTQAQMENGRPSPTLGPTVAGGSTAQATRVVLLQERSL